MLAKKSQARKTQHPGTAEHAFDAGAVKDIKVQNYKNIAAVDLQIELDDKTVNSGPDHESSKLDGTVANVLSRAVRSPRFEFPGGIDNPETFSAGISPQAEVFQTPVGGRCFLPFRENITEGRSNLKKY